MKKVFVLALVLVMTLSFVGYKVPAAYAQGFNVSWDSSFQVLNLNAVGGADAGIDMYYYNPDGTLATMATGYSNPDHDTVLAGQSNTYFPVRAQDGFSGSVVISSNQPIAVISNLVVNTSAKGLGSYVAFQQGSAQVYFPLVMKGNASQTTTFNVQNTGSGDVGLTIKFTKATGSTYPDVADVPVTGLKQGAATTFDLNSATQFSAITKWVGSVTVVASTGGSIAGVATTVNTKYTDAFGLATYNGFSGGSSTVVLPLIQEANNGNRTSINCQNIDPAKTVDVSVTYIPNTKTDLPVTGVIPNGTAIWLQNTTGTTFVGAAQVTSSDPTVQLVCVVIQQKPTKGTVSAYEGFNPADAAKPKIVAPLVQSNNGSASSGFVYSSINLATSDGAVHPVKCDFNPGPGFTAPPSVTGTGLASYVFLQNDVYGNKGKFLGGATCSVTDSSGVGIFAIVNQTRSGTPQAIRDVLSTYDAFNQP